ncbi:CTR9 RNA polymerase-associated protein CTR9 [Candida maltosa Xu316]
MEESAADITYYIGSEAAESSNTLDVPLVDGQVVSIDLKTELSDDPSDLIQFLIDQKSQKQYWIIAASGYAKLGKVEESMKFIKAALGLDYFSDNDIKTFESFVIWLHLQNVFKGIDKEENLNLAKQEISKLNFKIQHDSETSTSNSTSNLLSQAILNLYESKDDDATEIFDRILRIDPNNCFAILGKAQSLLNKSKNYSVALKLYQQVLILNPVMKPDPRLGIGLCFWFLKDDKMAIQAWERSLELDPTNIKSRIFLNLAKFHNTFTNSLSDEEFLENYKNCIEELSKIQKSTINDSTVLLTLASFYFAKDDYEVVKKIIGKVVNSVTGSDNLIKFNSFSRISKYQSSVLSQCAAWLARIEFNNKDFTQSSKYFQEAIKLDESNIVAKLGLGQSQYNRGSIEEASLTFESILRSNVKCLEANYSLGVLYSKQNSIKKKEAAIQVLERYIRLANNRGVSSTGEPVALNAYLILSQLYEQKGDMNQALANLNKAVELRQNVDKDVPLEIYNNIGVFQFMKQNYDNAIENFQSAVGKLEGAEFHGIDGDLLIDLPQDLKTTITFNLGRTKEISNQKEALQTYEALIAECPNYFSAKLRILFLNCISDEDKRQDIKNEIEELLALNASDLEIRSFYGWFIKNFGKKLNTPADADTKLQKETLVDYDSHDCYALISLANIYCIMGRDVKGADAKKTQRYYLRAVELFSKVLSLDPKNVYAAQGLAIVYIENKQANKGLDILRKIRDSLNDISVFLNLGHVLCDLKNYGKAIENYELALARYTDGNDSKILTFLGRAWYLRGNAESNLLYLKKALEYAEKALEVSKTASKSALLFNLSFIQFQIAEFVTKQPINQRSIDDIKDAIDGLNKAIEILTQLSSEDEKHPPYPREELRGRANLGSSTLLNRLSTTLADTERNIAEVEEKIEKAKQLRYEDAQAKLKEEEERLQAIKEKESEMSKQRLILQEQAQQWAEENRSNVVVSDDNNDDDDGLFNEESSTKDKKTRKGGSKGKRTKGKGKKRNIIDDSEEEDNKNITDESDGERKTNGGKRKADRQIGGKKKKAPLSNEFINDSDDDDDDLFGDNEEEA